VSPAVPVDGKLVHNSDTILTMKRLPKSIAGLGAGAIGCEYASMFSMAGSHVYLVDRKTLKLHGVHIMGDAAANLIHIGQAVMDFGGDVNYFIRTVFNYPTLAEAYKTAAFHAVNQIKGTTRTK
jgi:pyruvate/2-oxoglutarate dehydrogenase complex dihydrolipoamide dehydrogenase (E3) component